MSPDSSAQKALHCEKSRLVEPCTFNILPLKDRLTGKVNGETRWAMKIRTPEQPEGEWIRVHFHEEREGRKEYENRRHRK